MSNGTAVSGAVAGLLTGIQVGAALFASQLVVADLGVGLLGVLRYGIALLFLLPLLILKPGPSIAPDDRLPVILLGLGQVGVMIALLNAAVSYTSAARVALIFATLPAVSLIIEFMRGRSFGGFRTGLGVVLSIGGVAILVGTEALTGGIQGTDLFGMIAAGGATLCVAFCSSLYQPYITRYGAVKISTVAFTVSMVPLILIAFLMPPMSGPAVWPSSVWWLTLTIGLSSGVGYLMWFHAIKNLPATLVTGFLALSPITAALLSLVFLESTVTPFLVISVTLVCAGIACFTRRKPPQPGRKVKPI